MTSPRDASTPPLLLLLAALAAPSAGLLATGLGPSTPEAFLAVAAALSVAWVAVVLPALAGARPIRVLDVLLACAPFLVYGTRASPGPAAAPWAALALAAAVGLVGCALPAPWRGRVAVAAASVLGAALLAPGLGWRAEAADALPRLAPSRTLRPPAGDPIDPRDLVPAAWRSDDRDSPRRPGSLARVPAGPVGPAGPPPLFGARFAPVPPEAKASLPRVGPCVYAVGGPAAIRRDGSAAFVVSPNRPADVLDLDAFDALFAPADVGADDPALTDTLASFARRGGLLVLSTHPAAIPGPLASRLAVPAVAPVGVLGARAAGLGRVARAAGEADVQALLASGAWRPRFSTAFDRAISAPTADASFPRWEDDPALRLGPFWLLSAFAVAAAFVTRFSGVRRVAALVALSGLATTGVLVLASPAPAARAEPFAIDLGGEGGRRVEGVFVAAGPCGWVAPERIASRAGLRALGFDVVRVGGKPRLVLAPLREGWIVEEAVAAGGTPGQPAGKDPPTWAASLLSPGPTWSSEPSWEFTVGEEPYRGPLSDGLASGRLARLCSGAPRTR